MKQPQHRSLVSRKNRPSRRRGLTLIEMLVVCALFSLVGVVTLSLYNAAYTEFEAASGQMTLSRHARNLADKLVPILSTATPVRTSTTEPFYHPDGNDLDATGAPAEIYECDFYSTECLIADSTPNGGGGIPTNITVNSTSPGPITNTDGTNNTYSSSYGQQWYEPVLARWIWEIYPGQSDPVRRSSSLYRYRLAWTLNGFHGFKDHTVYLEREDLEANNVTGTNPTVDVGANDFATGTVYPLSRCSRRVIEKNIAMLSFQRILNSSIIQVRERVYNVDTDSSGRLVNMDGEVMRNMRGARRNYDILTTVMVPNQTLGRQ